MTGVGSASRRTRSCCTWASTRPAPRRCSRPSRPAGRRCSSTACSIPGRRRSHHPAAMAMTKRTWGVGREGGWDPDPRDWDRLARAAVRHPGRVLISSESFALTPDEAAARMVADLGSDRVHVVFTMRPDGRAAQLVVAAVPEVRLDHHLRAVAGADRGRAGARCPAIGLLAAQRLPRDRGPLGRPGRVPSGCTWCAWTAPTGGSCCARSAALLDLPEGVVDEQAADSNRSMTAAEAELLRSLNEVTADWDWPTYQRTIRTGAAAGMVESRRPDPSEPPIVTPAGGAGPGGRARARGWPPSSTASGWWSTGTSRVLGERGPAPVAGRRTCTDGRHRGAGSLPIDAAVAVVLGAIRGASGRRPRTAQKAAAAREAAAGTPASRSPRPGSSPASSRVGSGARLAVACRRVARRGLRPERADPPVDFAARAGLTRPGHPVIRPAGSCA